MFCRAWSPVWLMPVRVTPSAAFFFSLRLRVRFRSADHSWASRHREREMGKLIGLKPHQSNNWAESQGLSCTVSGMQPRGLGSPCLPADLGFPAPPCYPLLTAKGGDSSLCGSVLWKENLTSQHSGVEELPHPAPGPHGTKPPASSGQQGSPEASPAFLEPSKVDRS